MTRDNQTTPPKLQRHSEPTYEQLERLARDGQYRCHEISKGCKEYVDGDQRYVCVRYIKSDGKFAWSMVRAYNQSVHVNP
jgi:hypothetical protein